MTSRRFRGASAITLVLSLIMATPLSALAAAGDLDPTFGTGGVVTTAFGTASDVAWAMAIQSGGKVVVAGECSIPGNINFCLARYNSDGGLDAAFGTGGKVTTPIGSTGYGRVNALAVQGDGKIVAVGFCFLATTYGFCLARYNSDGSPDSSFGTGGLVTTIIGPPTASPNNGIAYGVALQGDGKIVAAGYCGTDPVNVRFCLARYNNDGSLDSSFGTGGTVTTSISPVSCCFQVSDVASAVVVQGDGKIVAAGTCQNQFCLARYTSDGSLDAAFGPSANGLVTTAIGSGGYAHANALAVQVDGKIVAAGPCNNPGGEFCLARYTSAGSLDTSFGAGASGYVTTAIQGFSAVVNATAVQSDGKIVAAGTCVLIGAVPYTQDFCLARYTSDGSLDTSFGTGGTVVTTIAPTVNVANGVAIQSDGKIVAAGWCGTPGGSPGIQPVFCLARYDGGAPSMTNLTVTAPTTSKILNAANPTFTPTYSGFVNGDSAASLTTQPTCSTTALTGSPVGSYPVTCSGGVSANYSLTFVPGTLSIIYGFDGFLQPINDTAHTLICGSPCPASIFKGGSTVPVKFQLHDANGLVVQASTTPLWITPQKGGSTSASVDETVYSDPATPGTTYSWDGSHYSYNWSTKGFTTGYFWRIGVHFDDGRTYYVSIGLR